MDLSSKHAVCSSTLEACDCSALRPSRFTVVERAPFPLIFIFYSCADLLVIWAKSFYTTWRLRGTLKFVCNMHNKNIHNEN
jgi:hypothetical protein